MRENLLVIGAGASFGAREVCANTPPLGDQLCSWLRIKVPTLLNRSDLCVPQSILEKGNEILCTHSEQKNFELLVQKLEDSERLLIQRLIQVCFSELSLVKPALDLGFNKQADLYDDLVRKMRLPLANWNVISLNYDVLFETALERGENSYRYPFFRKEACNRESGVNIYKPHGSINFFSKAEFSSSFGASLGEAPRATQIEISPEGKPILNHPIVFSAGTGGSSTLYKAIVNSGCNPVMANYTRGKLVEFNFRELKAVRRAAVRVAQHSKHVLVIGVRPILDSSDDSFVCELISALKNNSGSIAYVSKGNEDARVMESNLRESEIYNGGFESFLREYSFSEKVLPRK